VQQLKAQIEELHALLKARPKADNMQHACAAASPTSVPCRSIARTFVRVRACVCASDGTYIHIFTSTSLCARNANSSERSVWYTRATQSCMSAYVGLLQPYQPRRLAMYAQICSVGQSFSADVARCAASARTKPVIPFSARRCYLWLVLQAGAPAYGAARARFCGDRRERRGARQTDSLVCICCTAQHSTAQHSTAQHSARN
jgi:hypothetical protein